MTEYLKKPEVKSYSPCYQPRTHEAKCSYCGKAVVYPPGPSPLSPFACDASECREKRDDYHKKNRQFG